MRLRRNAILDRLWLILSGGAALALALHGGAQFGQRGWSAAGLVAQAAQAGVPDVPARANRLSDGCRTGVDPVR